MNSQSTGVHLLLLALVIAGPCGASGDGTPSSSQASADASYVPAVPPISTGDLVRGNNEFALDLYHRIAADEGNLVFSPYSVSLALAVTFAGARGATAAEMGRVLHLSGSPAAIGEAFAAYRARFEPEEVGGTLNIVNSLWCRQDYPLESTFVRLARHYYGATVRPVDFEHRPEGVRREINQWVATATRNRIADLIAPGGVAATTRLVVGNAVYFKGKWQHPFDPGDTLPGPFTLRPDESVDVPMMHETAEIPVVQLPGLALAELPYEGGDLSMIILLPDADDGLANLEHQLGADVIAGWLRKLDHAAPATIELTLPKFRATLTLDLSPILRRLGMESAFRASAADFSGISRSPGLLISDVVHRAFIDVDEEGTEAAAATAVETTLGARYRPDTTPTFEVDHPFLYLIRDNSSGGILFLGRVVDPR